MTNKTNLINNFCKEYNDASSIIDLANDYPLSYQEIDEYFTNVKYIIGKNSNAITNFLLSYCEANVKKEPFDTGNILFNEILKNSAKPVDISLAKENLLEPTYTTISLVSDEFFAEIQSRIANDSELNFSSNAKLKSALYNLTPIIKAKFKRNLHEYLEYILECTGK